MSTFTPSDCSKDPAEDLIITAMEFCGVYEGSGTDVFSTCRTGDAALTQSFLDLCIYDYCENYLTTDPNEQTTSVCEPNGKYCIIMSISAPPP